MPREFTRSERVSGQLRRELSTLVQQEVKDPRLGFVGISDVEVTRDLAHATVWVTVFNPEQAADSMRALKQSSGFLRRRLGQEMRMRVIPELHFKHDRSVETGRAMDDLIGRATEADLAAQRGRGETEEPDGDS